MGLLLKNISTRINLKHYSYTKNTQEFQDNDFSTKFCICGNDFTKWPCDFCHPNSACTNLSSNMMLKMDNNTFKEIVSDTQIPIRLSFLKRNGYPGILSLWYLNINGKIYCATQKTARIVSYLKKNLNCGFEISCDKLPYKGTRGEGTTKILDDMGQKALDQLIDKYLGKKGSTLSEFLKSKAKSEVAIEITPHKIFQLDYSKGMRDV